MTSRALTAGEARIATAMFGGTLDPARVTVRHARWFFLQPRDVLMTPAGAICCHPGGDTWRADFASEAWPMRGLFVHELVHAWQHQHGIPLAWVRWPFARYGYRLRPGKPFFDYGLEQQAEIVRHAYLQLDGFTNPRWPPLAELMRVLPFQPQGS